MTDVQFSILIFLVGGASWLLWDISNSLTKIQIQVNSINFTSILTIESELLEIKNRLKHFEDNLSNDFSKMKKIEDYLSDISFNTSQKS